MQAFKQQFVHTDIADNYSMNTTHEICYPGSKDRGTRRTVLWTLYSNHDEMATFLDLIPLPTGVVSVCSYPPVW